MRTWTLSLNVWPGGLSCSEGRRYSNLISAVPGRTAWNCQRWVPPFPRGPFAGSSNQFFISKQDGSGLSLSSQWNPVVRFSARDISSTSPIARVTSRSLYFLSTCIILGFRAYKGPPRANPTSRPIIVLCILDTLTLPCLSAPIQFILTRD